MFRERSRQTSFLEASYLLFPDDKAARVKKTWAEVYRHQVVPLIEEKAFAPLFHASEGRPNKPVEIVVGTLILKEMFDLTDREALEQLEYNLLWQHALWLTPEEAHCCQKTLHNFRVGLLKHDLSRLAFEQLTAGVVEQLGLNLNRQRMDSTHIVSNIAILSRLGLFCETIRVFLKELSRRDPGLFGEAPDAVVARYLKEDGSHSSYDDARSSKARRRLTVCGRDLHRLIDRFRGTTAASWDSYKLLERLFDDQCEVVPEDSPEEVPVEDEGNGTTEPEDSKETEQEDDKQEDDDAGEDGARVALVEPKNIASSSLQTPHDPTATYGHKGIGFEVQVCESIAENEDDCRVITGVAVTDSCGSDANALTPMLDDLQDRELAPTEVTLDTTYGSAENALEAQRRGIELVAPIGGTKPKSAAVSTSEEPASLTAADFKIDIRGDQKTTCPAGHEVELEEEEDDVVHAFFPRDKCEQCPLRDQCPVRLATAANAYYLKVDLRQLNRQQRRAAEANGTFRARYKIRAGIEATNSELKRRHGLGRLRVRGRPRVELAVFFKAAACNIKRMIGNLMGKDRPKVATQSF